MTREECREAIEGPAGVVGFEIEPRLVNAHPQRPVRLRAVGQ